MTQSIRHERSFEGYSNGLTLVRDIRACWLSNKADPESIPDNCQAVRDKHDLTYDEWLYWCRLAKLHDDDSFEDFDPIEEVRRVDTSVLDKAPVFACDRAPPNRQERRATAARARKGGLLRSTTQLGNPGRQRRN